MRTNLSMISHRDIRSPSESSITHHTDISNQCSCGGPLVFSAKPIPDHVAKHDGSWSAACRKFMSMDWNTKPLTRSNWRTPPSSWHQCLSVTVSFSVRIRFRSLPSVSLSLHWQVKIEKLVHPCSGTLYSNGSSSYPWFRTPSLLSSSHSNRWAPWYFSLFRFISHAHRLFPRTY